MDSRKIAVLIIVAILIPLMVGIAIYAFAFARDTKDRVVRRTLRGVAVVCLVAAALTTTASVLMVVEN